MSRNEFFEWNDPFTGYESDADLLRQLRMEYENDALHDQWKTRLQKMHEISDRETPLRVQS